MKKWYHWFILTAIYAVGGAANLIEGKGLLGSGIQIALTVFLAFAQLLCERNGERGRKVYRVICGVVIAVLVVMLIYLLYSIFGKH